MYGWAVAGYNREWVVIIQTGGYLMLCLGIAGGHFTQRPNVLLDLRRNGQG
jgi:hypothetical protein